MRIVSVSGTMGRLAACVEVASILLVSSAALAAPQLVLVNAKVFTADPALPYAQAVAIEDGRILAVGSNDQVRALTGPNTRILDAGGRLVTPGLTEASWFRRRRQGTEPVSKFDAGRAGPKRSFRGHNARTGADGLHERRSFRGGAGKTPGTARAWFCRGPCRAL